MAEFGKKERRDCARIRPASMEVRIQGGEVDLKYPAVFTRDISTSGLGIVISGSDPAPYEKLAGLGEPVHVEFDLPDGFVCQVLARIMWGQAESQDEEPQFRLGLMFLEMDRDTVKRVNGYVKWLTRGGPKWGVYEPDQSVE